MKKIVFAFFLIVTIVCFNLSVSAEKTIITSVSIDMENIDMDAINKLVEKTMNKSGVPGISIVLVSGNQSIYMNYGYSNVDEHIKTSEDTYYELGSMSKAFTALGILLLEDEGKLSLTDPVTKYLPWFQVYFKGIYEGKAIDKKVDLTIANLLYHTSGIPFHTIGDIPEGISDEMLEKTVRNLNGIYLDYYPGERFQYASINYDVLGLIIQMITGQTYENFIQEQVLTPLGLNHTYLFQNDALRNGVVATGYKSAFFGIEAYNAPIYRGNVPAGYIISNSVDMDKWIRIQMGQIKVPEHLSRIINTSHIGDISVPTQGNYYYAGGWNVNIKGKDIWHGGSNPNFSSMIIMKPELELGICILTNLNSNAAEYLARNILNIVEGKELTKYLMDDYKSLDIVFSIVIIMAVFLSIVFLILLINALIELIQKKRVQIKLEGVKIAGILLAVPLMLFLGFCLYYLPNILLQRLPWHAVKVWCSPMVMPGCISFFFLCIIFMLYVLLTFNFPKRKEINYFAMIPLSLINGITSAMIIFTINESFNRNLNYSKELFVYFIFALSFFLYTIKLLRGHLIIVTNEITYEKRINIIEKIMNSSYETIENIGPDRVFSGLNNDCAEISQVPNVIVTFLSNILTLIFCLGYLSTKSIWTFIISMGIIFLNGLISFITSQVTTKYWERNRDVQDTYFNQMQNLVNGFKELALNMARRIAFFKDTEKYTRLSIELNKIASIKLLNFELYNCLMYNLVFGIVVFVFPILFFNIDAQQLRENLLIIFYMLGPFGAVIGAIPRITQLNVNIKRINKLIDDLQMTSQEYLALPTDSLNSKNNFGCICLQNVVFRYKGKKMDEDEFILGPISCRFCLGELIFITGGNGSGKSTLGKLITGLYTPDEGKILFNECAIETQELNEMFAAVYSDFNLFKKLYGIDCDSNKEKILKYMTMMQLQDKVEVNNEGEINNINLSTGQKKRLAFVVSCLEDKPFMIFDEWAAEQDIQFRSYFYEELLPMLKRQGKGIIVITHDERYFNRADKLIKLEQGKLIKIEESGYIRVDN